MVDIESRHVMLAVAWIACAAVAISMSILQPLFYVAVVTCVVEFFS